MVDRHAEILSLKGDSYLHRDFSVSTN